MFLLNCKGVVDLSSEFGQYTEYDITLTIQTGSPQGGSIPIDESIAIYVNGELLGTYANAVKNQKYSAKATVTFPWSYQFVFSNNNASGKSGGVWPASAHISLDASFCVSIPEPYASCVDEDPYLCLDILSDSSLCLQTTYYLSCAQTCNMCTKDPVFVAVEGSTGYTWQQFRDYCVSLDGDLASILNYRSHNTHDMPLMNKRVHMAIYIFC
ncbi:hypothetical protein RFI_17326 [Reticulomyxa filosa]|uniref:ShKT domain-containing protein n=1 Tax=Reticulomyxa filosa TaxID=46433 RepID=X6N1I5_RETFI|nr:hypothetical protein RFI_17326 [Reticulomyxa filosa]|eukprot:ETO19896.1 hypothetical protein RFI_17326 [Reticulomyxa filosa]